VSLRFYYIFHYQIFVLACLRKTYVQVGTCSRHVEAQFQSKHICVVFDWVSVVYVYNNFVSCLKHNYVMYKLTHDDLVKIKT
jgi:hypothetical protein